MGIYFDMQVVYKRADGTVAAVLSDDQLAGSAFWAAGPAPTTGRIEDELDLLRFVDPVPGGAFYKTTTTSDSLQ